MKTGQVVGLIFATFFFSAIPCVIYGCGGRNRPKPLRPKWAAVGYLLLGMGLLEFGLLTNYFLERSAQPVISGVILEVTQSGGRSPSSSFMLLTDAGKSTRLNARYTGPSLVNGARAEIQYMEYDHQVLHVSILSGATQGWTLEESDGPGLGRILSLLGLASLVGAYRTWPSNEDKGADYLRV